MDSGIKIIRTFLEGVIRRPSIWTINASMEEVISCLNGYAVGINRVCGVGIGIGDYEDESVVKEYQEVKNFLEWLSEKASNHRDHSLPSDQMLKAAYRSVYKTDAEFFAAAKEYLGIVD